MLVLLRESSKSKKYSSKKPGDRNMTNLTQLKALTAGTVLALTMGIGAANAQTGIKGVLGAGGVPTIEFGSHTANRSVEVPEPGTWPAAGAAFLLLGGAMLVKKRRA